MPNKKTVVSKLIRRSGLFLFALVAAITVLLSLQSGRNQSYATANSSTINFQARLLSASGAVVPDGTYNIDFKLYNASSSTGQAVGSCTSGGSTNCEWEESYVYGGYSGAHASNPGPQITVQNGYVSVYLGQYNPFPNTINWDQPQYLTMNIDQNGTTSSGAITWDGEMSPRIQMTALPYAFTSSQLANNSGANRGTLSFGNGVTNNPTIYLPNVAGTNTLCLENDVTDCGFAPTTLGTGYIQNQSASPQTASFNITGTAAIGNNFTLGTSSSTNATIVLNNSGNSNQITINTTTTTAGYTLTLPTSGPQLNECIMTSASSTTQLTFGACNGGPTLSHVVENDTNGTNTSTLTTFTPQNIGDLVILSVKTKTGLGTISVTGGGVTTWSNPIISQTGGTTQVVLFYGTILTTTGSPITITVSGIGSSGVNNEIVADEFNSIIGSGTVWTVESSSGNTATNTTVTYPTLTPHNSGDLYWGYAYTPGTGHAGSTTGFAYEPTGGSNIALYNYNTTQGTAYTPTASQTSNTQFIAAGALIRASAGAFVNNGTTTQQANFNIQAATSNTVAGTLQANLAGTADILDLLNGSGAIVSSTSYAGQTLNQNSINSTTAYQFKNAVGTNILNTDTTNNQVDISNLASPGAITAAQAPATPTITPTGGTNHSVNYSYEVTAVSANGAETYASTAGTTAVGDNFSNLTASDYNNVSWTSTGASYYKIYRTVGGTSLGLIGSTTSASFHDIGITAGAQPPALASSGTLSTSTTYYYEITALDNTGGESMPSAQASIATSSSYTTNTLSWAPVTGARAYNVYRTTTSGTYTTDSFYTTYTNSLQDTGGTATGTNVVPPTANSAYSNNLNDSANATITLGSNGTASAQIYVGGSIPSAAAGSITETTGIQGIAVSGSYTYTVSNGSSAFSVYSTSNPANPVQLVTGLDAGYNPQSISIQGHYAYLAEEAQGFGKPSFAVWDITNPTNPTLTARVLMGSSTGTIISFPNSIYVKGNYAYIVDRGTATMALLVYNIVNPAAPYLVSSTSLGSSSSPFSVFVFGNYAYIANRGTNVLAIYNVSNPASPTLTGSVTTSFSGSPNPDSVYVQGNYAYLVNATTNNVAIVNISNPSSPILAGTVGIGNVGNNPATIFVQGNYAYVTSYAAGTMSIINVSNAASPTLVGTVTTTSSPSSLYVSGRYAYVGGNVNGTLQIFDLGGGYIQQLQAGGTETGTLQVDSNAQILGDENIQGGLNVGGTTALNGNVAISGSENLNGSLSIAGGIQGGFTESGISTPSTPTVTFNGTTGTAATWSYKIVAVAANGGTTPASTAGSISASDNTTLSTSNYNIIQWSPVAGAVNYKVYRTAVGTSPSTTGLIATTSGTIIDDTGLAGDSTTASTLDTTGAITVNGFATLQNTTNSTTAYQFENAAGTNLLNVNTTSSEINTNALSAPGTVTASLAPVTPVITNTCGSSCTATYQYEVVGIDANGAQTVPSPASTSATSAPTVLNGTTNKESLNITATTNIVTYLVYRTTATSATGNSGTLGLIGSTTSTGAGAFVDSGQLASTTAAVAGTLTNATQYFFKVTAIDSTGGESLPATEVNNTATTATNLAITLSWSPVTGARGYRVYYGTTSNTEANYITTYTNSYTYQIASPTGNVAASPPTSNTAYNNTLASSGNSQITLGNTAGSASTAQLDVAGVLPVTFIGSASTKYNGFSVLTNGNYAYVATGNNGNLLQVLDISNPANPFLVGSVATNGENNIGAGGLAMSGHDLYLPNQSGTSNSMQVIDVSNPAAPTVVTTVASANNTTYVYVSGRYLYTDNRINNTAQIFDISNPANPVAVGSSVSLQTGNTGGQIFVQGRYEYITGGSNPYLQIFDVSNPASPVNVSNFLLTSSADCDVYVQGSYAYVTCISNTGGGSLQIFNVSNPANPISVGSVGLVNSATNQPNVYVQGRYAYVTNPNGNTLATYDVSNPAKPLLVSSLTMSNSPYDLEVQGRYVYIVNGGGNALQIYDVGGAYIQQAQTGGLETGTLQVDSNTQLQGDASVGGGLSVGGTTQLNGNLGVGGQTLFANQTNSTTALQVQNAAGTNIMTVDTTNSQVNIGTIAKPGTVNVANAPNAPTVTPTGGTATTNYSYEVTAVSSNGLETLASTAGSTATGEPFASLTGSIYNAVSWSSTSASYYKIYRTVGGTTQGLIGSTTSTSFNDTGIAAYTKTPALASSGSLSTSTTYYYEVTALDNTGGQSVPSNQASAATTSTYTSLGISWAPVAGARGYNVYRSTTSGVYTTDSYYTVYANYFIDTGATATGTNTVPPTLSSAYANNLDNSTNATITLGNGGTSAAQLYIGGTTATNIVGTGAASINATGVYTYGQYAYVLGNGSNFEIFNISNPANPIQVGQFSVASQVQGIYVVGRYAYITTFGNPGTFQIVDVSNPSNPVNLASINIGYEPTGIYVSGNYAYALNQTSAMDIINVANPASPTIVSTTTVTNYPESINVQGRYAYIDSGNASGGLQIYDISNPASPTLMSSIAGTNAPVAGNTIAVSGSYLYIVNVSTQNFLIYDISNPANPIQVGSVASGNHIVNLSVQGRYAYILQGTGTNAIQTVDISNPYDPVTVGYVSTNTVPTGMSIQGHYAYITHNTTTNSLEVYSLGGEYAQQFQAGGIETGTLQVDNNAQISGDTSIQGGLNVGGSTQLVGNVGVAGNILATGTATFENAANSTTALQVQNAAGTNVMNVDTTNAQVDVGTLAASSIAFVTTAPNTPTVTPTGGTNHSVSYSYEITTVLSGGESWSSTAGTTATGDNFSNLTSSNYNSISWSAVGISSEYKIYRTVGGTTQGLIGITSSTSFNDTGLGAGIAAPSLASSGNLSTSTTYYYEVTSLDDAGGQSIPTGQTSGATTSSYKNLLIGWAAVPGARGYNVYRSLVSGVYTTDSYYTVYTNSFNDTGATATGTNTVPPTASSAYANNLSNNANATITIGSGNNGANGIASATAQLFIGGSVPTAAVGSVTSGTNPESVYVLGNYAYVANKGSNTLGIYDVSNPTAPVAIGSVATGSNPIGVFVAGHYAYVTNNGANTLGVYDVSNSASPVATGSVSTGASSGPEGLYVSGRYAYVTNFSSNTLGVYDVSNPASPVAVANISTGSNSGPRSVYLQGRYAYVTNYTAGTLAIFDVSNPASPVASGSITSGGASSPQFVYVQGRYAYVANRNNSSMTIFDISNPAGPIQMVSDSFAGSVPVSISVQGRYAYVLSQVNNKVYIVDVSNPTNPQLVGTITNGINTASVSAFVGIFVSGRYLYVPNNNNATLAIFDLGGAYTQQLQAGSIETGSLQVDGNSNILGSEALVGGITAGQNIEAGGNLGIAGGSTLTGSTALTGGQNQLATPTAPTVTPTGTTGSTSYSYTITAINAYGGETIASPVGSTASGNATLTTTNYNALSWSSVTGATGYKIYRTVASGTSPTTTGLIGSSTTTTFNDTGQAGAGNSSPTVNTTAQLTVEGAAMFQNAANSTTALQVNNATGTTLLNVNTSGSSINTNALSAPGTITASLAPVAPTATKTGSGTATYQYEVVGVDANGAQTVPSPASTASSSAPNTLSTGGAAQESLNITSTGATTYLIYRTTATSASGNSATLGLIGSTTSTGAGAFIDTGQLASSPAASAGSLTNGTQYFFKVTALDGTGGQTTASAEANNTATTVTNNAITVSWVPVTGARGYNVYYATSTGTEANYFTTYTNSYTLTTTTGNTAGSPPAANNAYNNTLSTIGNSQITLGNTAGSASSAQLDVAGVVPTTYVGSVSTGSQPHSVYTQGNYAYVANYGANTLVIYNISTPANPVQVGSASTGSNPISVYVQGNYAYVANYGGGTGNTITIYNVANPSLPTQVGLITTPLGPYNIYVSGNYVYSVNQPSNSLTVYNVTNPASPVQVGTIATGSSPESVYVQGNYAYVANSTSATLTIYSIATPANPSLAGTVTVGTAPISVYVQGNYAYVVNSTSATLSVINVSNPANPISVGLVSTGASPRYVYVQSHYAYVAITNGNTLQTIDISNPATPFSVGSVSTGSSSPFPEAVSIEGRYAYVVNFGANNMVVFDIGGAYVQQLQAGGTETGTLTVDSNANVLGSEALVGSITTGQNIDAGGNLGIAGGSTLTGSTVLTGGQNQLATPTAPTVTPTGTAGSTNYSYTITAINAYGGETVASTAGSTSTGNATLTNANYNALSWSAVTGATGYKIYRTVASGTSPTTTGLIGSSTTTTFNDTGLAGAGNTSPTINTTAQLIVEGAAMYENTTNSTAAFQINNAAGTTLFNVDTSSNSASGIITLSGDTGGEIILGSATNGITYTYNGSTTSNLRYNGAAMNTKYITLTPEYAGAVLSNGGLGNSTGTMTSGYDSTQKENYYNWTTNQGSNQAYQIVITVPIPTDFGGWASTPIKVDIKTSNTTNGTVIGYLYDTTGTVETNWNTCSLTPGGTSWSTQTGCSLSGTYNNAGGKYLTLILQVQAPNAGNTEVGNINLSYLSTF
jgi:hypothetical protein